MTLWDRWLFKKYLFSYFWISISAYAIHLCTDIIYKVAKFEGQLWPLVHHYGARLPAFFLISMPVISFISLIICITSLHRQKEWHNAKLLCLSNLRISRAFICIGPILCLIWVCQREISLPYLFKHIENSSKKPQLQLSIVTGNTITLISPLNHNFSELRIQHLSPKDDHQKISLSHHLIKAKQQQWTQNTKTSELRLPSPLQLKHRSHHYTYASLKNLITFKEQQHIDPELDIAILERLAFPLIFLVTFCSAAHLSLRQRHMSKIWFCPCLSLCALFFSCMCFKGIALKSSPLWAILWAIFLILTSHLVNLNSLRRKRHTC